MTRKVSARRQLTPSVQVAKDRAGCSLEARLEFITPVFGGGVRLYPEEKKRHIKDPDWVTPVRGASLRGQLRAWWRRACCTGIDRETMRAREKVLWGWASTQNNPAKGWVSITVDARDLRYSPFPVFEMKEKYGKWNPRSIRGLNLAYACFPLQTKGSLSQRIEAGVLHKWGGLFSVRLDAEPLGARAKAAKAAWPSCTGDLQRQLWAEVERTWLAFVTFGGLGGRTRRGFGAVRVVQGERAATLDQVIECLQWRDRVTVMDRRFPEPESAHYAALRSLRCFRQGLNIGRNPGNDRPGRSRWPAPDAIRRLLNTHALRPDHSPTHPLDARYPRAAFGMPIIFHFKDRGDPSDTTLQPRDAERLASPLVLRPVVNPDGGVRAIALRLPSRGDLSEQLKHLTINDKPVSGHLSATEQGRVQPLREHRGSPSAGADAVFEPFLNFFKKH